MQKDNFILRKLYEDVKLSAMEREVLDYIINNLDEAMQIGVRGVAQKRYTSSTTVIRLSKKLNYDGFREMIYSFKNMLTPPALHWSDELHDKIHFYPDIDNLNQFFDILDHKGFICINGQGYSRLIGEYLANKLISSACTAILQDSLEAETIIRNFKHKLDAMIIISKSGNNLFALAAAKQCQEAKIPTILFTGNPNCELKKNCDTVFIIKDNHPFDIENVQSNYFFGYCILTFEELFDLYYNRFQ